MDEHDPRTAVTAAIEPVTREVVMPRFGDDEFPDAADQGSVEDWPTQVTKHGVRLRTPTAVLLALLLAAAGLWGGAFLQKHDGSSTGSSALPAAARAALAGSTTGRSLAGSPFGSSSDGTTGTVTDIVGNTLYVTNATGALVKVTLSSAATVTRDASSSLSGLKPGDTVTVQGTKVTNGAMTASSVSATAKGVSSTAGFAAP